MSLSRYLQTIFLPTIRKTSPDDLKKGIIQSGKKWFSENSSEQQLIEDNLQELGLNVSSEMLDRIIENILLHYYEKLLPLAITTQQYHQFLTTHIDGSEAFDQIGNAYNEGRGVLLATAHFGAVEFITPYLSTKKLPMNVLLRFTTEQMSRSAHELAEKYYQSGLFGQTRFIEIGKPNTRAALDMAAVLRRNEFLLAVFDEKTDYSIPVDLFTRQFWGGAGLHKLIAFTQRDIALFTIFMVRMQNNRYRLIAKEVDKTSEKAVQLLYDSLSDLLTEHLEQWYFVHEELPFVESEEIVS